MAAAPQPFPPTRWTFVECAAQLDHPAQPKALDHLLTQYLPALKAFLIAQFRVENAQADDLLQSFVLEKVMKADVLLRAERQRGKFRTFLLNTLTNFVVSEHRRGRAQKRSPAEGIVSLDELPDAGGEVAMEPSAASFDLAFARQIIHEAVQRMRGQCENAGRPDIWGVFQSRLLSPIFDQLPPARYEELVERFGFQSPGHASNVLTTAKRMFARILRVVVSEYAGSEKEIDAELKALQAILSEAPAAGS